MLIHIKYLPPSTLYGGRYFYIHFLGNDPENLVIFKDVHEPIIDRSVWELAQQKRNSVRKRCTNNG